MRFPHRKHRISRANALAMTRRYRRLNPKGVRAFCFPRSCFELILAQPGCAGIRAYLGAHEDDSVNLILVGVDEEMEDMLRAATATATATAAARAEGGEGGQGDGEDGEGDGVIMQDSFPCPIYCGGGDSLND